MTVDELVADIQTYLHDQGDVWSEDEILHHLNDGYRNMISSAGSLVRPYQTDVPGRVSSANTHEWERFYTPGTCRLWTRAVSNRPVRVTFLWETESLEGISPTNSYDAVTQLWEQAYSDDIDAHFRFILPRATERPLKVYWDSKRLAHTSVRELDQSFDRWWRDAGEPIATTPGTGPDGSLEVYLLQTAYQQSWQLADDGYPLGLPRQFSSDDDRTYETSSLVRSWDYAYTSSADSGMIAGFGINVAISIVDSSTGSRGLYSWETDLTTTTDDDNGDTAGTIYTAFWEAELAGYAVQLGVGITRGLTSSDRQYLPVAYDSGQQIAGIPRKWQSSDDALTIWETVVPDRQLTTNDTPGLIPSQLHKYLKFYVLGQAFSRQGEGYRPDLAQHWLGLYNLGVSLLAMLGTPSVLDRVFAREQVQDASIKAPPRVRLPATFPVEGRFL